MTARLLACSLVLGIGVVSACGGATSTSDIFGGGGDNGSDASSGVDSGNTNHHDSGVVGDDATTGDDGSTQFDSSPMKDATPPPQDTGPPPVLIKCEGTGGCHAGTQACCRNGTSPQFTWSCTAVGQCNGNNALEIPCDTAKDCDNGDVCCVTADNLGMAADISCQPPANCMPGNGKTWMCDPNVSTSCPPGGTLHCLPSQTTIPGYNICR
jgi:hypothetical protein